MKDLTGILGLGISGLAAFELLKKQNKNIVVFDDKIKPNLKLKKYWKNYISWDWNNISRIIITFKNICATLQERVTSNECL